MGQTRGKNRRRQLEVFDSAHGATLSVDSQEEIDFTEWLCEARELGVINDFSYQPDSFLLFENTKYTDIDGKKKTLFQDHKYSCDFVVAFDPAGVRELAKELKVREDQLSAGEISAFVDTKGLFNRNQRSFSTDRKWVWEKFGVYVVEIIPVKFFSKFGCPRLSFNSKKTKKARKMFLGFGTIAEKLGLNGEKKKGNGPAA